MAVDPRFIEALRRLNPGAPPTEEEYIPRDAASGRGWNVLERVETLLLAGTHLRALLHGCTGIGKSTEFARWKRALEGRVVVVPVTVRALDGDAVLAQVVLGAFEASARLGTPGAAERSEAFLAYWEAWNGDPPRDDVDSALRNERLQIEAAGHGALLVLFDGMDLMPPEEIDDVFGAAGSMLGEAQPPFVATVPHTWALRSGPGSRHEGVDAVWHLPPLAVIDEKDVAQDAVLDRIVVGLTRRLGDASLFESPALLRRIAIQSGGVPRHAVLLLRQALLSAAGSTLVRAEHVLEAERELRQDLLHSVTFGQATPQAYLSGAMLSYEGRDARFERPHPLLR